MSDTEVKFIDGLGAKAPHQNAPEFVKAKLSIKREDLIAWLELRTDEWINCHIKESSNGKWYVSVDDWSPDPEYKQTNETPASNPQTSADFDDDIPF